MAELTDSLGLAERKPRPLTDSLGLSEKPEEEFLPPVVSPFPTVPATPTPLTNSLGLVNKTPTLAEAMRPKTQGRSLPGQVLLGVGRGIETVLREWWLGFNYMTHHGANPMVWKSMLEGNSRDDAVAEMRGFHEEKLGRKGEPVEEVVKGISEFLVHMLPANVVLGTLGTAGKVSTALQRIGPKASERVYDALGKIAQGELAALYAENMAFGPYEARLSNLVEGVPALRNPITALLKADENDTETVARVKQNIEALGAGLLTTGLLSSLGGIRRSIRGRHATKEAADAEVDKILLPEPDRDPVRKVYENLELSHTFVKRKAGIRAADSNRIWLSTNTEVSKTIEAHHPTGATKYFTSRVSLGDYLVVDGKHYHEPLEGSVYQRGPLWADIGVGPDNIQGANPEKLKKFYRIMYRDVAEQLGYTADDVKVLLSEASSENPIFNMFGDSELDLDTISKRIVDDPFSEEFFKFYDMLQRFPDSGGSAIWNTDTIASAAEVAGFDSVIIKNIYEHFDDPDSFGDSIVVFDQARVLSPEVPKIIRGMKPNVELGRPPIREPHEAVTADVMALPDEHLEELFGGVYNIVGIIGGGKTPFNGVIVDDGTGQVALFGKRVTGATYEELGRFDIDLHYREAEKDIVDRYMEFREEQYHYINQAKANAEKALSDEVLGRPPQAKQLGEDEWVIGGGTGDVRQIRAIKFFDEAQYSTEIDAIATVNNIPRSEAVELAKHDLGFETHYTLGAHAPFPETQHASLEVAQQTYRQQQQRLYDIARAEYVAGPGQPAIRAAIDDKVLEMQWDVHEGVMTGEQAYSVLESIVRQLDPDKVLYDDELLEKLLDRAANPPAKMQDPGDVSSDKVLSWLKAQEYAADNQDKLNARKLLDNANKLLLDTSGPLKARLLLEGGDEGQKAVMRLELAAGASQRTDLIFQEWRGKIYAPLGGIRKVAHKTAEAIGVNYGLMSKADTRDLNRVIKLMREWEIARYKPESGVLHEGSRLTAKQFEESLRLLKHEMGTERFDTLRSRAHLYFDAMREQLSELKDHGLITAEEYKNLSRFNYQPRQFVDAIDPGLPYKIGNKQFSVSSSGIEPLGKGANKIMELDSGMLLAQVIGRTQSRVARNEATRTLAAAAEGMLAGNNFLSPNKFKNSTALSYIVDGKRKQVYVDSELATQWVHNAQASGHLWGRLLLAETQRMFATGMSPEFGLIQFPRDVLLVALTNDQYSNSFSKSIVQIMRDIGSTGVDAIRRTGEYEQYIREGGGMSYLTHGARTHTTPGTDIAYETFRRTLGYVQESAESIIRLAIRKRALRNGLTNEEAAYAARSYMDFAIGGSATKQVDVFVPYINASMQGLRTFGRAMRKHPIRTNAKLAEFAGLVGAAWVFNQLNHPEVMNELSDDAKNRYFHFPTGLSYTDNHGNKIHLTAKLAVDHNLMPIKATVESLFAWVLKGEKPDTRTLKAIRDGWSIVGRVTDLNPGVLGALNKYVSNWDDYTGEPEWKGPDVRPSQEVKEWPNRPTNDMAVDFARTVKATTGMEVSPARLEAVIGDIFSSNVMTMGANKIYAQIRNSEQYRLTQERASLEILQEQPFLRKLLHKTYPTAQIEDKLRRADEQLTGEQRYRLNQVDQFSALAFRAGEFSNDGMQFKRLQALVESVDPFEQRTLVDRYTNRLVAMQATKKLSDPAFGSAQNPSWWMLIARVEPQVAANVVFEQYQNVPSEKRKAFLNFATAMPAGKRQEFLSTLGQLMKEHGYK